MSDEPLTVQSILDATQLLKKQVEEANHLPARMLGARASYGGFPIHESMGAVTEEQWRNHNPRKGSPAYHRRIQKKWKKRYGTRLVPAAYMADFKALGMGQGMAYIMHPALVVKLKQEILG